MPYEPEDQSRNSRLTDRLTSRPPSRPTSSLMLQVGLVLLVFLMVAGALMLVSWAMA
jgi:hypothetical protein